MTINEYQSLAMRTNDGQATERLYEAVLHSVNGADAGELLNGALGLTGEAGEVADIIKKYVFHKHDLNKDELIKELGDVCWYIALLAKALNVNLEDIMNRNIEKLKKRYPGGFTAEASINRI